MLLLGPVLCVGQMCDSLGKATRLETYANEGISASTDGSVIFGQALKTGEIKVWSSKTGELIKTLRPDNDSFARSSDIVISSEGAVIAARLRNRKMVWVGDIFSGQKIAEFATPPLGNPSQMKISPDGKTLLTGNYDQGAALWEVKRGRLIGMLSHPSLKEDALGNAYPFLRSVFSPDSNTVATAFWGYVYLWEARSAKFLKRLYSSGELKSKPFGNVSSIYDLEFSPDGSLLAAAGRDGRTQLWEVDSGELVGSLEQGDRVFSVVFSKDGRLLATVSYDDRNIKVWDTSSGRLLHTVKGRSSSPFSITFSNPQIGLIAVPIKNGVEFREAATGKLVQKCDGMFGYFLPNGETFVAGLKPEGLGLFRIFR